MKLITRNTDYAIRAIAHMAARQKEIVSVASLVRALRIPRPFLRKILQILGKRKLIRSYKGTGGGFTLALRADKIYLVDIMEIFQGPLSLNECMFKKDLCSNRGKCPLKRKIDSIEKYVKNELSKLTVASLI